MGVDPNEQMKRDHGQVDYHTRNFDFLTDNDRKEKVRDIQEKYTALEQEIQRTGFYDDEDRAKLRELYRQRLEELSGILNPQELQEYDVRASGVASQLRHDLEVFDVSEEEFRRMFAVRKAREEDLQYPSDPDDKAGLERRKKAVEEADAQLRQMLGDERFAQYKRSQDYDYRQLVKMTERWELPRERADTVYSLKEDAEEAVKEVRNNKELSAEQREETLRKIREETESAVTEVLGADGFRKYTNRQGWWLRNLSPDKPKPRT